MIAFTGKAKESNAGTCLAIPARLMLTGMNLAPSIRDAPRYPEGRAVRMVVEGAENVRVAVRLA